MAKTNQKGRSSSGPNFIQLFNFLVDSPAWHDLTPGQRSVYITVARRYKGSNNGFITLSVRDAAQAAGVNKDTAARALSVLVEHGFLQREAKGSFSQKLPMATEWSLTAYRNDRTNQLPSRLFLKWTLKNCDVVAEPHQQRPPQQAHQKSKTGPDCDQPRSASKGAGIRAEALGVPTIETEEEAI